MSKGLGPIFDCFKNKRVGDTLKVGSPFVGLSPEPAEATVSDTDDHTYWTFDLRWKGLLLGSFSLEKAGKSVTLTENK